MRLYWEFLKNTFQTELTYRTNTVLNFVGQVITIFIQVSIWRALLQSQGGAMVGATMVTFRNMVTYTIISSAISLFVSNELIWIVDRKIRTGEIAMDLIKPINLKIQLLSQTIGSIGSGVIIQLVPLLLIGAFGFGLATPTVENGLLFFIAVCNGLLINFLICYLLGLSGFWWNRVRQFNTMLRVALRLFSGSFVPLWFFPKVLADLAMVLPFRLIYYTPISIYMGKLSRTESGWQILLQFLWIGSFLLVEHLMWNRAIRRLVIQGG